VISDQKIDADAVMRNHIEFDPGQDIMDGILICRIQRQHAEFDKSTQNESRYVQLLITLHAEHTNGLHIRALLVEHDKKLDWDEDKLKKLHQVNANTLGAQVNFIGNNWLLDDVKILSMTMKAVNGGYRWDIFITKGVENNVKRLFWIDAER
jgi:hypothetical protein